VTDEITVSHTDRVRDLFDAKAAGWSGKYASAGPLAARLRQLASAVQAHVPVGGELVDLGCGSGELARHLAARNYLVTGCDIADQMLNQAKGADHARSVRWVRLEPGWRTLPFAAASLDAVVAASVLEYVLEPASVLRECARVLRPGGVLLCTVPNVAHPVRWAEWPLAWSANSSLARVAGGSWPRLEAYLTYLRVSRQRRPVRWWERAAGNVGLQPLPPAVADRTRAPLRLLAFGRGPGGPGTQFTTRDGQ
jgi:ubiquinone/menaquinone biosynthesis C-methylase UbiE